MKFLRTVSTKRLLAMIAGFLSAIAVGAAIAVAATGNGPVPKPKPLAQAVHDALAAPKVYGITARISFSNHLISSTDLQGSDPILTGATGRLWLSPGHGLRLELQGNNGDGQVVVNDRWFWVYDPQANTAYEAKLPAHDKHTTTKHESVPTVAEIQSDLNRAMQHIDISGAMPTDVAGQPTYTVKVSPKHSGGLLGSAQLAWDAIRGVPLRFAVYARGDSTPVLELKATDISYGRVDASTFKIQPPSDAKVVKVKTRTGQAGAMERAGKRRFKHAEVTGAAAVQRHLPFALAAPSTLVGLPRQSAKLLDWAGHPAALVTYGQNLGGVAVIEQDAKMTKALPQQSSNGDHHGLSLPTVSINGATGQELDTALGTVVRFTRGGVTYTVIGSVPAAAAEAAARGL
jgi:outer membrane lipoprotein-sorting protein